MTRALAYAGIGARRTPERVRRDMTRMAAWLAGKGWRLRSGGARGADEAFATGAPACGRTLYLPWPGYNGRTGSDLYPLSSVELARFLPIAAASHPAWDRCSPTVRKLHARNVAVLLGESGRAPVAAAVCWTEGGRVEGGTGMAIRVARSHGVPVLNMATLHPRSVCERLNAISARSA